MLRFGVASGTRKNGRIGFFDSPLFVFADSALATSTRILGKNIAPATHATGAKTGLIPERIVEACRLHRAIGVGFSARLIGDLLVDETGGRSREFVFFLAPGRRKRKIRLHGEHLQLL